MEKVVEFEELRREYEPCDWHFGAETDLFVVSTAFCVLLVMAKRFGHFDQPTIG